MNIRPIDLADDEIMLQMYAVFLAVRRFERPHFVASPAESVIGDLRHDDPGERVQIWGCWEGDVLVGVVEAWLTVNDNLDTMWAEIGIHPDHRCRGHGTAAVETLVAFAREHGRTRIVGDVNYPADRADDHPDRRFLERRGFRLGQTEIIRILPLPVEQTLLAQMAAESRAAYEPVYRVETFTVVPEPLRASLCACMNRVATDAPTGELDWEPESVDPERYAGWLALDAQIGRVRLTSVAIEQATGQVVAYSELALPAGITRGHQWGTLVLSEHRGRRLGQAVKAANLVAVQSDFPTRVDIVTGNAHDNPWMVSINERLGFERVELAVAYYRLV